MSAEKLGDEFRLNYDSASNYTTPNWTSQVSVGDIGFDFAGEQVEVPKRISVKTYKMGRQDWELSFTMNYDSNNAWHMAVRTAIEQKVKMHLAVSDGDIETNGVHYWHAWWALTGNLGAALDDVATIEVTGKCHADIGPSDLEIPAPATVS